MKERVSRVVRLRGIERSFGFPSNKLTPSFSWGAALSFSAL